MTRAEFKEIISKIIERVRTEEENAPPLACLFGDTDDCDVSTLYGINEED